jgi:hypothetical protein
MSQRQLLDTLKLALQDGDTGLAAQAQTIAIAEGLNVRTDFTFDRWALSGKMMPGGGPNVSVTPTGWAANTMLPNEALRDAVGSFNIGYENFSADMGELEDNVSVVATALIRVLDRLREFSDTKLPAGSGTVVQVLEAVSFTFGAFGRGATSSGFLCSVNIQERGTE